MLVCQLMSRNWFREFYSIMYKRMDYFEAKHTQIGLIPYTLTHTNLDSLEVTDRVNIETDILAKYLNQED